MKHFIFEENEKGILSTSSIIFQNNWEMKIWGLFFNLTKTYLFIALVMASSCIVAGD